MNGTEYEKLDNPVWHSLSETHKDISVNYQYVKFYDPAYCPFGGFIESNNISTQIDEYSKLTENFFVVGNKPVFPARISLRKELICLQMVLEKRVETGIEENLIQLDATFSGTLSNLVNEVQPGYFKKKTNLMGDYFGVIKQGKLAAVTGERMKMYNFTEVSAVVTHPSFTGRGFAKQLVAHTVNKIFDENKTPYLHVAETNFGAIKLYEKLGFRTRRKISFWNLYVHP
ncbi:MAG TPA: GNAT family N-acetyltransferase [Chitinophagaceae bacterium]|jgi:GNAT superfamily N-acetyltransferase|nr:GNAT family N-acetyltransferase [Chitinophagaceae bacterium]